MFTTGGLRKIACFFIIDVYIDISKGRESYDDYIEKVRAIVEKYGYA